MKLIVCAFVLLAVVAANAEETKPLEGLPSLVESIADNTEDQINNAVRIKRQFGGELKG